MSGALLLWSGFALAAGIITFAGYYLSRYGDIIADKTGLGGSWIGLILLATATSVPELATGISAVTIAGTPDIAMGDIFGSCVFNLVILFVIDLLYRKGSIYSSAGQGHILSAGCGLILIGFAGFSILASARFSGWSIAHIGAYAPVILLVYFGAMRLIFRYEKAQLAEHVEEMAERYPGVTLKQAGMRFAIAAAAVLSAGTALPFLGEGLAEAYGWRSSFVGTLFVAAATSLPEMVVTLAAVRIGALDMAIANLLGSNLFNIAIIAIDDVFYRPGPILGDVSAAHAASALAALAMTGAVIVGLVSKARRRIFGAVWVSFILVAIYLANAYALFEAG